ncbi:MAG: hypothetical protein EXS14_08080 [Planctomycetes bacterium]|nr:hypothetical protein [Planctomycetota bacterium]
MCAVERGLDDGGDGRLMDAVIHSRCARVLELMRASIGDAAWKLWFVRARFVELKRGTLQLGVPNVTTREWITTSFGSQLERLVAAEFGATMKIEVLVHAAAVSASAETQADKEQARRSRAPRPGRGFEEFAPTAGSAAALKALRHFMEGRQPMLNPLLVCGSTSSGKTHLADAAQSTMSRALRVLALNGEKVVRDFGWAQRSRHINDFRGGFLRADCVILDDVQALVGKVATQRELSLQLKELLMRRGKLLAFSQVPLAQLSALDPVLASLLCSGMTVGLGTPSRAEMAAILRARFAYGPARIPSEAVDLIAARTDVSLRDLELLVKKTYAFAGLSGAPVTEAFLDQHLSEIQGPSDPRERRVRCIFAVVCEHFAVPLESILSRKKTRTLSPPRGAAAFLLKEMAGLTLKQIGERLGQRSHTAVHQMVQREAVHFRSSPVLARLSREVDRRLFQPKA